MVLRVFLGSSVLCAVGLGLSQLPDPGILGIHDEPGRTLFYGGAGLLAGLSGFVAVLSGINLAATRVGALSEDRQRFMFIMSLIVLIAVLIAIVVRLELAF